MRHPHAHVLLAAVAGLLATLGPAATPLRAQQPTAAYYDTSRVVTITGILRANLAVPPPSPMIIIVETRGPVAEGVAEGGAAGEPEMWVLSGNAMTTLRRDGWQLIGPGAAVKARETITVTAYLPKDTARAAAALGDAMTTMPTPDGRPSGPPGFIADIQAKRSRLAYGLEITTASGRTLRFGDVPR